MVRQCIGRAPSMGDRVLLRAGHLGEGPGCLLRDENRVEAEALASPGLLRNRSSAFAYEEVVDSVRPETEDRLEGGPPIAGALQQP